MPSDDWLNQFVSTLTDSTVGDLSTNSGELDDLIVMAHTPQGTGEQQQEDDVDAISDVLRQIDLNESMSEMIPMDEANAKDTTEDAGGTMLELLMQMKKMEEEMNEAMEEKSDTVANELCTKEQRIKAWNKWAKGNKATAKQREQLMKAVGIGGTGWEKVTSQKYMRKPQSKADISDLEPILISELQLNAVHEGRVLRGRICGNPVLQAGVNILFEDSRGDLIELTLYCLDAKSQQDAEKRCPMGLKLSVKEPYYKVRADGTNGIRVDVLHDLVFEVENCQSQPPKPTAKVSSKPTPKAEVSNKESDQPHDHDKDRANGARSESEVRFVRSSAVAKYKESGNTAFGDQNWERAISMYTKAIEAAESAQNCFIGNSCSAALHQECGTYIWSLFANRSAAHLQLRHPQAALSDAERSIDKSPTNTGKPHFRLGKASLALGKMEEARNAFETAQEIFPHKDFLGALRGCKTPTVIYARDYPSLSSAVSSAPAGSEILVDAGTYAEPIIIRKPLTIRAICETPNEDSAIRVTDRKMALIHVDCTHGVRVETTGLVRLHGFVIIAAFHAVYAINANLIMENCFLKSTTGPGLAVNSGSVSMAHCSVADCSMGTGILVSRGGTLETHKVHLTRNAATGLEIREAASARISETTIYGNGQQGILLWCNGTSLTAINSNVHSHPFEAGVLVDCGTACLTGCRLYGHEKYAVVAQAKGSLKLFDCEIDHNAYGVHLQEGGNGTVERCEIHHNTMHGIFIGSDHHGKAKIHNNIIHDNNGGIEIRNQTSKTDVENNHQYNNEINFFECLADHQNRQAYESKDHAKTHAKDDASFAKHYKKAQKKSTGRTSAPFRDGQGEEGLQNHGRCCKACGRMPKDGEKFQLCARCQLVLYCCKACQATHWKASHKDICQPEAKYPMFKDISRDVTKPR
jgi:tetratricopeptide (TPR) repeat protein